VPKKAFLTTNIRELLSNPIPVTYKDPECPTISCTIGQTEISRALLDLGASINLLPLSVYQQLGLGELHPTRVTIQLADQSVKVPKGKITDVLIQVRDFIYPIDFIVLETQPVFKPKVSDSGHLRAPIPCHSQCHNQLKERVHAINLWSHDKDVNVFNLGK